MRRICASHRLFVASRGTQHHDNSAVHTPHLSVSLRTLTAIRNYYIAGTTVQHDTMITGDATLPSMVSIHAPTSNCTMLTYTVWHSLRRNITSHKRAHQAGCYPIKPSHHEITSQAIQYLNNTPRAQSSAKHIHACSDTQCAGHTEHTKRRGCPDSTVICCVDNPAALITHE
jgi:hypothetical protein